MSVDELRDRYERYKAEADLLAGDLYDIPRRVALFLHLYEESRGNHPFSLIAAHGALWGFGYFEAGGSLGRLIGRRYYLNRAERAYRLGLLQEFAEGFRRVNRQVCVDTLANYMFTKQHGREPGADQVVPAQLLDALVRVHGAAESGRDLDVAERRDVFERSFRCEQEVTVAPGVKQAVSGFNCRIMKFLILRPIVRMAYFPALKYMMFRDFSAQEERIEKGLIAYELAARRGWPGVRESLADYGLAPLKLLERPGAYVDGLKQEISRLAATAATARGALS